MSKTSSAVKRRYNDKVYGKIEARLPKALVAEFKAAVVERGDTIAGVIRKAIEAYLAEGKNE